MNHFRYKNLVEKFITIGVNEEGISSSEKRRLYTVNFSFATVLLGAIVLLFLGITKGYFSFVVHNIALIFFLSIGLFLCKKGKHTHGVILLFCFFLAMQFSFFIMGDVHIIPIYLIVLPIFGILVLPEKYQKIILFVLCKAVFLAFNSTSGLYVFFPALYITVSLVLFYSIFYFFNILEAQERETELAILERNKLIDQLNSKNEEQALFAEIMSHDLKAPIRNIKGFSTLLERSLKEETGEIKEYLDFIVGSADTMNSLVADLLVYFQVGAKPLEAKYIDLNVVLESLLLLFEYDILQKNIQFEFEQLPVVLATKDDITTLFKNLLSNSIKYQPKDDPDHIPKIVISYKKSKDFDHIYFKDNGIGIDQAYINKLFKPFQRFHSSAEYSGTGLGMSICKKVIEKYKGDIQLEPSTEQGTVFKLSFPKEMIGKAIPRELVNAAKVL